MVFPHGAGLVRVCPPDVEMSMLSAH